MAHPRVRAGQRAETAMSIPSASICGDEVFNRAGETLPANQRELMI